MLFTAALFVDVSDDSKYMLQGTKRQFPSPAYENKEEICGQVLGVVKYSSIPFVVAVAFLLCK